MFALSWADAMVMLADRSIKTDDGDRWPQGAVDVTDYGAVPDGETNNAAAIARAAAHCVQLGGHRHLALPTAFTLPVRSDGLPEQLLRCSEPHDAIFATWGRAARHGN